MRHRSASGKAPCDEKTAHYHEKLTAISAVMWFLVLLALSQKP